MLMTKVLKIKEFYSLEDAAKRLSQTFEEHFELKDVLQFIIEDRLPLSWYMQQQDAMLAAPYTHLFGGWSDPEFIDKIRNFRFEDADSSDLNALHEPSYECLVKSQTKKPARLRPHADDSNGLLLEQHLKFSFHHK